ncbi:ExbD/TolR family protein [Azospira inquinata]|uniref:Biopolymer transporter ExbD n=1 Tax=Azospira inquinata TaxID=2785627 RepID=A0A975SL44_9RHOO|nr:biopolymer transporter ExbD [Azospira inquinata]QWT46330.1 biopolymer transporter ExbD [Azospira inquinata]QWT48343.1 biopolymer transporter ExbD [Azospira inquinata]
MSFGTLDTGNGRRSQPMADMNTTPLVDVMLVLLIIFIVCAPLMAQSIKVDLPQAQGTPLDEKPKTVNLSLDAQGQLFWDKQPLAEGDLAQKLKTAAAARPQPELQLSADKETRYQRLAEIMSAAREAGIAKLGFVTTPGETHVSGQ